MAGKVIPKSNALNRVGSPGWFVSFLAMSPRESRLYSCEMSGSG
jgi:hypothetical protein